MIIDGLWNAIKLPDGTKDFIKWIFHIDQKNMFREMMKADPDARGTAFEKLDFTVDQRLVTKDPGDRFVLNEEFVRNMIGSYNAEFEAMKPGPLERRYKDRIFDYAFALFRNDSEYFIYISFMLAWLVVNKEDFADPYADHLDVIQDLYDYWKENHGRERNKDWIDWGFRYIIRKYKRNLKSNFYKKSVNHLLYFIYVNAGNWVHSSAFYPEAWYGNGRGQDLIEMMGGDY